MTDVTAKFKCFKEASRHIWNCYLFQGDDIVSISADESFTILERELLRQLVFEGDATAVKYYRTAPLDRLKVTIALEYVEAEVQFAELEGNGNYRWSLASLVRNDALGDISFLDLFDWRRYGKLDHEYVRGVDRTSGRLVLIRERYCRYHVENPREADLSQPP